MLERETWVCIKNTARCSRGDTNGVGEDEVTVMFITVIAKG